jgi:hypothetical protein
MGYTDYWEFNKVKGLKAKDIETLYQKAIKDCARIIKHSSTKIRLSGYTSHTKVGEYGGIDFNGVGDYSHENFYLREHFNQNEAFNFCKTAQKPYDIVVVACLATLKYHLKESITVSSDGRSTEWNNGVELAKVILKRAVKNPIK